MRPVGLALLAVVLAGCSRPATTAAEDPEPHRQVTPTIPVVGVGTHGSLHEAKQIASMHLNLTRVTYYTREDSPQYRLEFAARLLDLRSHGLEVLVVVHDFVNRRDAPQWMAVLAKAFPGTLWQVGNEWDAVPAGYGTGGAYAELMKAVMFAMRNVETDARVVGMGLATADGRAWSVVGDVPRTVAFTRDYLAAGGPVLEAWCLQVYGIPLRAAVKVRVQAAHDALAGAMPVWLTEVGSDRENLERSWGKQSLEQIDRWQAEQALDAILAAGEAGVERVYFYQLHSGDDDGFGFLRSDATTERPIMNAMRTQAWKQN